ncbi:unnamed protein product [Parnassius mnemosyne]|uniref:Gag-like protein n=1 Tax=Parnassius mnemosyne TaxID=213953 RepID=A0AAV1KCJ2_9NEOP
MFGFRTPMKPSGEVSSPPKPGTSASPPNVRRSISDWEGASTNPAPTNSSAKTVQVDNTTSKPRPVLSKDNKPTAARRPSIDVQTPHESKYENRTSEARACLNKGKLHLSASRNIKTEIKNGLVEALDRLYQIVREAEKELKIEKSKGVGVGDGIVGGEPLQTSTDSTFIVKTPEPTSSTQCDPNIIARIEEHTKLLIESNKKIEELKASIDRQKETLERATYASVVSNKTANIPKVRSTLHSVVVTSKDETESGEEVLDKVRKAVDAKDGWIKVERVRKAKDRKIIIGFDTPEERSKAKHRLETKGVDLTVEEVRNKDPLLILLSVLSINTDEDIIKALRNQNGYVFHGLDGAEDRVEVISVSPTIWRRATETGYFHIDLQRVRVDDHSPLVQCSRCLGYGHSKKFCKEPADICSHCGGPHQGAECADRINGEPPACKNCTRAKLDQAEHNAFSRDCPIRQKWDKIARSSVAYC